MKGAGIFLGVQLLVLGVVSAQGDPAGKADRAVLDAQAGRFFAALRPVVEPTSGSVVEVRVWRKRVAYGTVVAPGRVLTKWSEVAKSVQSLSCRTADGHWLPATLVGVYREADLAVLEVSGLHAQPVTLAAVDPMPLGSFLAVVRPDGEAGAMGVVSVLPRSLRESDRAFLGVDMDNTYKGAGVKIAQIERDTGAEKAGLRPGDIVVGINDVVTDGNFELSTVLQRMKPGETIDVKYRRDEGERVAQVVLGGRKDDRQISRSRMDAMNKMGGHRYSAIREDFREVVQTDMQLLPEDCGAPVVNLEGKVVGIAIARAGRIKSFLLPVAGVMDLLKREPDQPGADELNLGRNGEGQLKDGGPAADATLDSMRRHMRDMQRLMEELEKAER